MTPEQKADLLIEWSLFPGPHNKKQAVIDKFHKLYGDVQDEELWLEYLKKELNIEPYWKAVGLL